MDHDFALKYRILYDNKISICNKQWSLFSLTYKYLSCDVWLNAVFHIPLYIQKVLFLYNNKKYRVRSPFFTYMIIANGISSTSCFVQMRNNIRSIFSFLFGHYIWLILLLLMHKRPCVNYMICKRLILSTLTFFNCCYL